MSVHLHRQSLHLQGIHHDSGELTCDALLVNLRFPADLRCCCQVLPSTWQLQRSNKLSLATHVSGSSAIRRRCARPSLLLCFLLWQLCQLTAQHFGQLWPSSPNHHQPTIVSYCCSGGPTGTGGSKVSAEANGPGNVGGHGGGGGSGGTGGAGGFGPGGNSDESADGGGRGRMQPLTIAFAFFVLGAATLNACFACHFACVIKAHHNGCLYLSTQICFRYNGTLLLVLQQSVSTAMQSLLP